MPALCFTSHLSQIPENTKSFVKILSPSIKKKLNKTEDTRFHVPLKSTLGHVTAYLG